MCVVLDEMIKKINEKFSNFFLDMKCVGEVDLLKNETVSDWFSVPYVHAGALGTCSYYDLSPTYTMQHLLQTKCCIQQFIQESMELATCCMK